MCTLFSISNQGWYDKKESNRSGPEGFLDPVLGRDILPKNQHLLHSCLYQISEDSYSYLYLYQNFENVYPNVQKTWKWISKPTFQLCF